MIESIRNSGARLDQPLQDSAQPVAKGGKSTASGISSLQSTVPPSTSSAPRSVASTFAPTSSIPAAEYDSALDSATGRFSAAADALNPATVPVGEAGTALSPMDLTRALFKAALQSNEHQQDDALQKRKEAMEAARSRDLAQAASSKEAAKKLDSSSWQQFGLSLAANATSVAGSWGKESTHTSLLLGSLAKAMETTSGRIGTSAQVDSKYRDAADKIAAADSEAAKSQIADANGMTERLRQTFQQLFLALSELRAEKANQLRALA